MERTRTAIRVGDMGDIGEVVPLFDAYRAFYGAAASPVATRDFLAERVSRGESVLLIASSLPSGAELPVSPAECSAVGFAHLYPTFSSVSLRKVTILNDLFVVPGWRRAGVARDLIAFTASYAAQTGALRVELATQLHNSPARRLYESLGFVPDVEFVHMSLPLSSLMKE